MIKQLILYAFLFQSGLMLGQSSITTIDTLGADSLVQVFYQNGQLFFQVPYIDGQQNGWYEQYHENGNPSHKNYRLNGEIVDGIYMYLYEDGNLYQKGEYKNGFQFGIWTTYDHSGKGWKRYYFDKKGHIKKVKVLDNLKDRWVRTGL